MNITIIYLIFIRNSPVVGATTGLTVCHQQQDKYTTPKGVTLDNYYSEYNNNIPVIYPEFIN